MLERFNLHRRILGNEKASNWIDPCGNDDALLRLYKALEDGNVDPIVFIKTYTTLQVQFYNIHANDGELRKVDRLAAEERGADC